MYGERGMPLYIGYMRYALALRDKITGKIHPAMTGWTGGFIFKPRVKWLERFCTSFREYQKDYFCNLGVANSYKKGTNQGIKPKRN